MPVQAAVAAQEMASSWMGFAGDAGGSHGAQQRLVVPLFTTSSVTGAGLPLLHAFLSRLQPTIPTAPDTHQVCVCSVCWEHVRVSVALSMGSAPCALLA